MIPCPNPTCGRHLSARVLVCPACGTGIFRPERVGDYEMLECVAESRTASIFRARKDGTATDVCLRLYNAEVALSPADAARLRGQFDALRELPEERFIHTLDFGQTAGGAWYRVTPWLPNVMAWGDLKSRELYGAAAGKRRWLDLCLDLAETFRELHQRGRIIPDMTLDDCLLYRTPEGALRVRLDATLASCLGPGSGREKAREAHPDYAPGRTLTEQSDVWTLGSILASMMLGTTGITDYAAALDALNFERRPVALHPKLGRLLRQMVDANPAERPRDMASVCEALRAFGPADIAEWRALERDPWRRGPVARRVAVAVVLCGAAVCAVTFSLIHLQARRASAEVARVREDTGAAVAEVQRLVRDGKGYVDAQAQDTVRTLLEQIRQADPENRSQAVLERYGRSVAFVLTEAWVEVAGRRTCLATASGTAFLVSTDGHLLSNRHVVAPWLSGETAQQVEKQLALLRKSGATFRFGASHWLWFDGDEAFRSRAAVPQAGAKVADIFRLDTAHTDAGEKPGLRVVGVMPKPADPAEFLASTLEDDVAILKVDAPPVDATPIPLRLGAPPRGVGLLVLGYSQGRAAIPGTRAQARASRGSASGMIGDVLTTDADLQPGNSGGPVLDLDGYAVGIASALFASGGRAETSMGRVLPIDTARRFLEAACTGRPAWDGLLESAFEPELVAARESAGRGDWEQARALAAVKGVAKHPDVSLTAAVYSLDKAGFTPDGRAALERVTAMAPHFPFAALLSYWDAWRRGIPEVKRPCGRELLEAEWSSPFESFGQVARLLDNPSGFDQAALGAETPLELALYHWAAGTAAARDGDRKRAAALLREALASCPSDDTLLRDLLTASLWFECGERPAAARSVSSDTPPRFRPMKEAFAALVGGDWKKATVAIDRHFETPRRESSNTLGLRLFRCQLHALTGDPAAGKRALRAYRDTITNPWYRQIADCLLGTADPDALLTSLATKRPETLTLAVALGLQAEARNDNPRALHCYRTALDTAQTNWLEFQLAQARRAALGKE
jgi:hypothetical protein